MTRLVTAQVDPYGTDSAFSLNLFYESTLLSEELTPANEIARFGWFPLSQLPALEYRGTALALEDFKQSNRVANTASDTPNNIFDRKPALSQRGNHEKRRDFVPWASPWIDEEELRAVIDVMESGWLSMGPRTAALEQAWATQLGASHAIAVSSGTVALDIALAALEIGPNDIVAVPAVTYMATVSAILRSGADPLFIDV